MQANPIRVLLVDGRPVRSTKIKKCLDESRAMSVVGHFATSVEAAAALKDLTPDVAVVGSDIFEHPNYAAFRNEADALGLQIVPIWYFPFKRQQFDAVRDDPLHGFVDARTPDGDTDFLINTIVGVVQRKANPANRRTDPARPMPRPASIEGDRLGAKNTQTVAPERSDSDPPREVFLIGASTGGVEALTNVLSHFDASSPPALVVQHMRHPMMASFCQRLGKEVPPNVVLAEDGLSLEYGTVYIAPGTDRHLMMQANGSLRCRLVSGPNVSGHQPSVDALFSSVAKVLPPKIRCVAALLTGMGADGAHGLLELRRMGGHTIAQDKRSSVVFGMPRVAAELGAAVEVLPLADIGPAMMRAAKRHTERA